MGLQQPDIALMLAQHLNVVPLSREHRDTHRDKDTEPMSTAAISVIQDQDKEPVT